MIGSVEVAGLQPVKGDLLTDKVNCCPALAVITIYVDNSADFWRRRKFAVKGQRFPAPCSSWRVGAVAPWEQPLPAKQRRSHFARALVAFLFLPLLLFAMISAY